MNLVKGKTKFRRQALMFLDAGKGEYSHAYKYLADDIDLGVHMYVNGNKRDSAQELRRFVTVDNGREYPTLMAALIAAGHTLEGLEHV